MTTLRQMRDDLRPRAERQRTPEPPPTLGDIRGMRRLGYNLKPSEYDVLLAEIDRLNALLAKDPQ